MLERCHTAITNSTRKLILTGLQEINQLHLSEKTLKELVCLSHALESY